MREGVSEHAKEGFVGRLGFKPLQSTAVNEVGRIRGTLKIVVAKHRMRNVVVQNHALHALISSRPAIRIEEIGVVKVGLKLAGITKELVYTPLVGR